MGTLEELLQLASHHQYFSIHEEGDANGLLTVELAAQLNRLYSHAHDLVGLESQIVFSVKKSSHQKRAALYMAMLEMACDGDDIWGDDEDEDTSCSLDEEELRETSLPYTQSSRLLAQWLARALQQHQACPVS